MAEALKINKSDAASILHKHLSIYYTNPNWKRILILYILGKRKTRGLSSEF